LHFERCALISLEKNARFLDLAGEHFMELDLDMGTARFTGGQSYAFQVLGTESEHTLSWLWAWAEEQTEMPELLTKASWKMKAWLEQQGLAEYALPSVDLDRADGMMFSIIGTDVCGADCYYREHYEGGALFILLYGTGLYSRPTFTRRELVRTFEDLIDRYDFNHRNALVSYYRQSGIDAKETRETVSATLAGGEHLIAEFEASGRLIAVNGEKRG
jgi:hypothetical protein